MTAPTKLEEGMRVVFVRTRFKEVNFPKIGLKGRVDRTDPIEDYLIVWDNGRCCWCYRDELRKLPDPKGADQ
jgi:hypothetical protein